MKLFLLLNFLFASNLFAAGNYEVLHKKISKIVQKSKNISKFSLGENDEGTILSGYVYEADGNLKKTNHLVVATHHGNEVLSAELAYEFIKDLSLKKGRVFKNKRIYIIPVLNRTGFNKESREEVANGKSFDPNRDYPDPCISKKDFNLKSTSLLADFVDKKEIIGAITIHGYYGSLTYPWGIYTDNYRSLDHEVFELKAQKAVSQNNYITGTHADILYPAGGAFEDWAYYKYGIWSLLVELENSPNFSDDIEMLYSSIKSFPAARSADHRHLGSCTSRKDLGISRP